MVQEGRKEAAMLKFWEIIMRWEESGEEEEEEEEREEFVHLDQDV